MQSMWTPHRTCVRGGAPTAVSGSQNLNEDKRQSGVHTNRFYGTPAPAVSGANTEPVSVHTSALQQWVSPTTDRPHGRPPAHGAEFRRVCGVRACPAPRALAVLCPARSRGGPVTGLPVRSRPGCLPWEPGLSGPPPSSCPSPALFCSSLCRRLLCQGTPVPPE